MNGHETEMHPLEPKTKPGLFCGWKLEMGARYRGALLILDYDKAKYHGFRGNCIRPIHYKEVHFPDKLVFPFAKARKLAIERMEPLKPPEEAPVLELPWDDDAVFDSLESSDGGPSSSSKGHSPPGGDIPKLEPAEKVGFQILPWRISAYGGTIGCKACEITDDKTRRHTPKCRARFEKFVRLAGRHNICDIVKMVNNDQ